MPAKFNSNVAVIAIILAGIPSFRGPAAGSENLSLSGRRKQRALVMALQGNDEKATLEILGPDGKGIVSSGDDIEDANSRINFVQRYQEMHRLPKDPDGSTILFIGARNWPTPIALVNQRRAW